MTSHKQTPTTAREDELQQRFHRLADLRRYEARLANPFIRQKEVALFSLLRPEIKGRFLEVGCGEGSNLHYLRQVNPDISYIGMDFSLEKVRFASQAQPTGLFVQADALRLPLPDASCDCLLLRDVLHHLDEHRAEVLREALRVLKPGGGLWVIEGNVRKLLNRAFSLLVPAERGMRNSTPEKFARLCLGLGACRLDFTEAFFLVRALNYFLGWSQNGWLGIFLLVLYRLAQTLEDILGRLVSRKNRSYMIAYFQIPCPAQHGHD